MVTSGSSVFRLCEVIELLTFKQKNGEYEMKAAIMKLASGAFLVTTLLSSAWAGEPLALYDNFNSYVINPNKWFGAMSGSSQNEIRESARLILLNRLQLLNRAYSRTDTDEGTSPSGETLRFINPDSVTAIKTTVQALSYQVQGCGDSDETSSIRARFAGYFFNTTDNPTPGSALNDVFASVGIYRLAGATDPPNTLRVYAGIRHCHDSICGLVDDLGSADLGTARLGQQVTLRLEWDPNNTQFIVQRDNQPEVFIPYSVPDSSPPGLKSKRLEVGQTLANCTAQPRPTAFVSAFFDNVYVNASTLNTQQ